MYVGSGVLAAPWSTTFAEEHVPFYVFCEFLQEIDRTIRAGIPYTSPNSFPDGLGGVVIHSRKHSQFYSQRYFLWAYRRCNDQV
jgi:hypothetical protein